MLNIFFYFLLCFFLINSSDLDSELGGFRFLKYIIVIPSIYLIFKNKSIILNPISKLYLYLSFYYIFLYLIGLHNHFNYEEIIIYLFIAFVSGSYILDKISSNYVLISLVFYFIYNFIINGIKINPFGLIVGDFSSLESNIIAFILPIILIYYIDFKRATIKKSILFILTLLSIKRITLISMVFERFKDFF